MLVISYDTEEVVHRFAVGRHPQRVRNGVVRIADFPQGKHGEPFRLGVFHERGPIGVRGGTERIGCRADKAEALRLQRCRVRITRGGTLLGAGERFGKDARAFPVNVKLTTAGRQALRRAGTRGLRATLSARGVDSVGRTASMKKTVRLRAAR